MFQGMTLCRLRYETHKQTHDLMTLHVELLHYSELVLPQCCIHQQSQTVVQHVHRTDCRSSQMAVIHSCPLMCRCPVLASSQASDAKPYSLFGRAQTAETKPQTELRAVNDHQQRQVCTPAITVCLQCKCILVIIVTQLLLHNTLTVC